MRRRRDEEDEEQKEAAERQQEVDGVDGLSTLGLSCCWVCVVCIQAAARSLVGLRLWVDAIHRLFRISTPKGHAHRSRDRGARFWGEGVGGD